MPRHSKNNTNSAQFSYAERKMIGSGTKKERLGRDSMKNFNACSLCLGRAIEPRCCTEGHLFCQECVLNDLISQKKDIKRQTLLLARMKETEADELSEARSMARIRIMKDFEKSQSGLSSSSSGSKLINSNKSIVSTSPSDSNNTEASSSNGANKRKFDLDEEEMERIIKEGEEEAMKKIELEMLENRRAKLPAFWLPSLTPSAKPTPLEEVKLQTLCRTAKPHPMSLKTLITVKFEEDSTKVTEEVGKRSCICGVCKKGLSNNIKIFALKPCGCVVCVTCVDLLCKPDNSCANCGTSTAGKDGGMIELNIEGTGFASGGMAESKRFDLSFQC